jgi:hypothetical protein
MLLTKSISNLIIQLFSQEILFISLNYTDSQSKDCHPNCITLKYDRLIISNKVRDPEFDKIEKSLFQFSVVQSRDIHTNNTKSPIIYFQSLLLKNQHLRKT